MRLIDVDVDSEGRIYVSAEDFQVDQTLRSVVHVLRYDDDTDSFQLIVTFPDDSLGEGIRAR